jgi:uncharacterized protein (TIRG00374 family)
MKRYWRIGIGLLISILLLWLATRNINWTEFSQAVRSITWTSLSIAAIFFLINLAARAVRWLVILSPLKELPFLTVFAYSEIGYLANILLPLRAGELIRAILLGQKFGISKSAVLATVAVDRLIDILNLLGFALLLPLFIEMPALVRRSIWLMGILALIAMVGLWQISQQEHRQERFTSSSSTSFPSALKQRVTSLISNFAKGLATLHSGRQILLIVLCSLTAWTLVFLSVFFILMGFDLNLPWYAALAIIVILNLGIMIPSSPGYIGVAHYLIVIALSIFDLDQTRALSVAFVIHGLSYLTNLILGLAFLWRERIALSYLGRLAGRIRGDQDA